MSAASTRTAHALRVVTGQNADQDDAAAAAAEAQAALAATSSRELLRKAYMLTHQMHGLGSQSAARDQFRAMRDLIDAELLRRMGEE